MTTLHQKYVQESHGQSQLYILSVHYQTTDRELVEKFLVPFSSVSLKEILSNGVLVDALIMIEPKPSQQVDCTVLIVDELRSPNAGTYFEVRLTQSELIKQTFVRSSPQTTSYLHIQGPDVQNALRNFGEVLGDARVGTMTGYLPYGSVYFRRGSFCVDFFFWYISHSLLRLGFFILLLKLNRDTLFQKLLRGQDQDKLLQPLF